MDYAGVRAQEFGEMFGYSQVVGFPTRKANTLDLIYSKVDCIITPSMKIGSSDHISISAKFAAIDEVPSNCQQLQSVSRYYVGTWHHGIISRVRLRGKQQSGTLENSALWMQLSPVWMAFWRRSL